MSLRLSAAASGLLALLAARLAAAALTASDAPAAASAGQSGPRISALTGVPSSVTAGNAFRVRGRVASLPRLGTARLTFTLRGGASRRAKLVRHLRGVSVRRPRTSSSRAFSLLVRVPRTVKPGRYVFRTCVRDARRGAPRGALPHEAAARARAACRPAAATTARAGAAATPAARPRPRQARRPPQPACTRHRRELLLRHGRPLRKRRRDQRPRRPAGGQDRGDLGVRPDGDRLVPRRRPQGPDEPDRLHRGSRHHGDLAHAELQEQGRAGQRRLSVRRLPRLLGHRLHADRPAPRHQRGPARARRRRARSRDEGLLRHHHQPHRRRHHVRARRGAQLPLQGRVAVQDGGRHPVRRPRLRRHERVPAAGSRGELPVHADQRRRAAKTTRSPSGSTT